MTRGPARRRAVRDQRQRMQRRRHLPAVRRREHGKPHGVRLDAQHGDRLELCAAGRRHRTPGVHSFREFDFGFFTGKRDRPMFAGLVTFV